MSTLVFKCGCKFNIADDKNDIIRREDIDELPKNVELNVFSIPPDCAMTWDLISKGMTKGIFQLEGHLGKHWAKKIQPHNLEHMSAIGAVLRPGCLRAMSGDPPKSMTQRYADRKQRLEDVDYFDVPELEPILKGTYGILVYQEQSMKIAVKLAGFDEQQADVLRKCVTDDTMFVSKTRGWISIKQLIESGYENDEFLIMDEQGRQQWKKLEKIWCTGKHDVRTVELESGLSVNATKHHQFLTNHGWVARSRLNTDDYVITANEIEYDGFDNISKELALVIAGIITEGYFTEDNSATFVNHDKIMMKWFTDAFVTVFGENPQFDSEGKVARLLKKHKDFIAKYVNFGLSDNRLIPDIMMGMTKETTMDFLSFMFSAEASFYECNNQIEFSSKSKKMLKQIQLLLLRFGIHSYIVVKRVKGYEDNYYRLYINDIVDRKKFLENITTYLLPSKIESLIRMVQSNSVQNYTKDIFPRNITKSILDQYPYVGNYEGGSIYNSSISRSRFQRLVDGTKDSSWISFANGRQRYDKITSLDECIRQVNTYDFTVEGNNTPYIIANGMVIHNSIGKKKPEIMAKVKTEFLEGCIKTGIVSKEKAEEIFGWIQESQKYQFNHSHSVCYGMDGYWSAYCKAHFPHQFFCSYLRGSDWKQDKYEEVSELVNDAKIFNIKTNPPDLRDVKDCFYLKHNELYFGLHEVRGIGDAALDKVKKFLREIRVLIDKPIDKWTWLDYLIYFSDRIATSVNAALISVGALDFIGLPRNTMLYEFDIWSKLTDKEKDWVQRHQYYRFCDDCKEIDKWDGPQWHSLQQALAACAPVSKNGGGCKTIKRSEVVMGLIDLVLRPPHALNDTPHHIAWYEEKYLGTAVSCSMVDACADSVKASTTCKEVNDGKRGYLVMAVVINRVKEVRTKSTGSKMAFLSVSDNTCGLDGVVIFPKQWDAYKDVLQIGNTVLLHGEVDKKNSGFIIKQVWQI